MPLVVSLTSEKNGVKTLQYASGHISASRNQSSSRFPERTPGPNICEGSRSCGRNSHCTSGEACKARRHEGGSLRGQPRFSPGVVEKVNVVTHRSYMPYGLIGKGEDSGRTAGEQRGGRRLTFGNI